MGGGVIVISGGKDAKAVPSGGAIAKDESKPFGKEGSEDKVDAYAETRQEAARELCRALGISEDKAEDVDSALRAYVENCS
jgi:hypothetical protein